MALQLSYLAVRADLDSAVQNMPHDASVVSTDDWTVFVDLKPDQATGVARGGSGLMVAIEVVDDASKWTVFVDGAEQATDQAAQLLGTDDEAIAYAEDAPWGFIEWMKRVGLPITPIVGDVLTGDGYRKRSDRVPSGWWISPRGMGLAEGPIMLEPGGDWDSEANALEYEDRRLILGARHRPICNSSEGLIIWRAMLEPARTGTEAEWKSGRDARTDEGKAALKSAQIKRIVRLYLQLRALKKGGIWLSPIEAQNYRRCRTWALAELCLSLSMDAAAAESQLAAAEA